MGMKGIDISSYQTGINLEIVPCDFVIIKATEGTSYVNPDCDRAYQQAKRAGKALGVYHYASGGNPSAEADYFLSHIKGYIGNTVLALDWESQSNPSFGVNDLEWCKTWLGRVYEKTGVRPLLYISQSVMEKFKGIGDYGLWIAQYASMNTTGYQESPWNEGTYSCAIRQYSSRGRLAGYDRDLDLNKFYGDRNAWNRYAKKKTDPSSSVQVPGKAANNTGLYYRSHVQSYGWLAAVHDGQISGTTGIGKRLEALKMDVRKLGDVELEVKAHIQGVGDKVYKINKDTHDTVIGTTGEGKRMEAISMKITKGLSGKHIKYRVHVAKLGWSGWKQDGELLGSEGLSNAIQAIQIKVE